MDSIEFKIKLHKNKMNPVNDSKQVKITMKTISEKKDGVSDKEVFPSTSKNTETLILDTAESDEENQVIQNGKIDKNAIVIVNCDNVNDIKEVFPSTSKNTETLNLDLAESDEENQVIHNAKIDENVIVNCDIVNEANQIENTSENVEENKPENIFVNTENIQPEEEAVIGEDNITDDGDEIGIVEIEESFGEPIQILSYDKKIKTNVLNIEILKNLLLNEDVKDCNVAVISIAGAFRKGKSFMLSFFLRYLHAEYDLNNSENWLEKDGNLSGFTWRGGSERETTGIWIWSKIFTKVVSDNGEKVGIILMDTQGTFDGQTTMKENATVFSLSTMLSSLQIYNLFHNIQEDDLNNLQLFTEYGKLALKQSLNSRKAFQKLLFLVRDWNFSYEAPYGFDGGRQVLEKRLEVLDDQDEELSEVRTHIKSCYEDIDCFLMPYPGKEATRNKNFKGELKDIENEFKECLLELVPMLLAPENISLKQINGENIKCKNFLNYIESYWNIFKSGKIPSAVTILHATAEANNLTSKNQAIENYHKTMNNKMQSKFFVGIATIQYYHNIACNAAYDIFNSHAVIGSEKLKNVHLNSLKRELNTQLTLYISRDEAKRVEGLEATIITKEIRISRLEKEQSSIKYWKDHAESQCRQLESERSKSQRQISDLTSEKQRLENKISDSIRALQRY